MKAALSHWQGRIAPVFDVAGKVTVIEIQNRREFRRIEVTLHEHEPLLRAKEVAMLGIEVLICGAVSVTLELALIAAGVRVMGFVCGATQDVLTAFVTGRLEETVSAQEFFMPGCNGGRRRFRNRRRG